MRNSRTVTITIKNLRKIINKDKEQLEFPFGFLILFGCVMNTLTILTL
jgi:hypothetical protein